MYLYHKLSSLLIFHNFNKVRYNTNIDNIIKDILEGRRKSYAWLDLGGCTTDIDWYETRLHILTIQRKEQARQNLPLGIVVADLGLDKRHIKIDNQDLVFRILPYYTVDGKKPWYWDWIYKRWVRLISNQGCIPRIVQYSKGYQAGSARARRVPFNEWAIRESPQQRQVYIIHDGKMVRATCDGAAYEEVLFNSNPVSVQDGLVRKVAEALACPPNWHIFNQSLVFDQDAARLVAHFLREQTL